MENNLLAMDYIYYMVGKRITRKKWLSVKIVFVIVIVMSKDIQIILVFAHARNVIVILKGLQ
jgi:hypothetical protein